MKFRKKPVVIDATQFDGSLESCREFHKNYREIDWSYTNNKYYLVITTLEGKMIASKGDWIIQGVNGELYPCKPDIFEKTYEKVTP